MDATKTYHEKLLNISRGYRDFISSFKRDEDDNADFIGFAEWLCEMPIEDIDAIEVLSLYQWTQDTYRSMWNEWQASL